MTRKKYNWETDKTVLERFQLVADVKLRETLIKSLKERKRKRKVARLSSAIFELNWANTEEWGEYFRKLYSLAQEDKIKLLNKPLYYDL